MAAGLDREDLLSDQHPAHPSRSMQDGVAFGHAMIVGRAPVGFPAATDLGAALDCCAQLSLRARLDRPQTVSSAKFFAVIAPALCPERILDAFSRP